ncbi:MAG: sulfite exporter TauE/SafE family protein [Spirochaetales bacterium]|nr:sulfite exporter TauE/SafE family protein [Spirochaetales bacterium]
MEQNFLILLISTFTVGCIHTLLGPDHYLPFIALSKSNNWSYKKTIGITTACGIGHIASGLILGLLAVSVGTILTRLDFIETVRGEIAAWSLTVFGFIYCIWGIKNAFRKNDSSQHSHGHEKDSSPWILFLIFVFGPCEPLIPLIIYPAVTNSLFHTTAVVLVFGLSTLICMFLTVTVSFYGLKKLIRFPFMERFGNAMAGGVIGSCGLAMAVFGL